MILADILCLRAYREVSQQTTSVGNLIECISIFCWGRKIYFITVRRKVLFDFEFFTGSWDAVFLNLFSVFCDLLIVKSSGILYDGHNFFCDFHMSNKIIHTSSSFYFASFVRCLKFIWILFKRWEKDWCVGTNCRC